MGAEWEAAGLFYGLLSDLNRLLLIGTAGSSGPVVQSDREAGRAVAEQAAAYLDEHFNENISLSNVASTLGYSHQYLNLLFRKTYGVSMHQYMQRIRLDKAIRIMKESDDMTIKEIAGIIGMETSYFISHFRKAKGMPPDQYRRYHSRG